MSEWTFVQNSTTGKHKHRALNVLVFKKKKKHAKPAENIRTMSDKCVELFGRL